MKVPTTNLVGTRPGPAELRGTRPGKVELRGVRPGPVELRAVATLRPPPPAAE
jgi:hypothetical protein